MKSFIEYFIIGIIVFFIVSIFNCFYNGEISIIIFIKSAIGSIIFVLLNVLFDFVFKKRKK